MEQEQEQEREREQDQEQEQELEQEQEQELELELEQELEQDLMSGGKKNDDDKAMMSLLPSAALLEVGKVFSFGSKKYGDHNWRAGIKYSRLTSAGMRHRMSHNMGKDFDEESKLYHLAHSVANDLMQLQFLLENRVELDDRYKSDAPQERSETTED